MLSLEQQFWQIPNGISLAHSFLHFHTPDFVINAMQEALQNQNAEKYSFPEGLPLLREIVSEKLAEKNRHINSDNEIIITCGARQSALITLLALCQAGDEILLPSPCSAWYADVVRSARCVPVFMHLDENENWKITEELLENAITPKTKAIFLGNPTHPLGKIFSKNELFSVANVAQKNNLLILLDETYENLAFETDHVFSLSEMPELKKNIICIFSISKAFCMTGFRVGFLYANAENTKKILEIHKNTMQCATVLSQYGAISALSDQNSAHTLAQFRHATHRKLKMTEYFLKKFPKNFSFQSPEASFSIFVKILPDPKMPEDETLWCQKILENTGVLLFPGSAFGPAGKGHFVIFFGKEERLLQEAFFRMAQFLEKNTR